MLRREAEKTYSPWRYLRNILAILLGVAFFIGFIIWRTDNPRMEQIRFTIADRWLPDLELFYMPFRGFVDVIDSYQSYADLARENRELRQELQKMETFREVALQLEQVNAELRVLNNLSVSPEARRITGEIISDSGSPFSQSALINIGRNRGVYVGAPALDGFGLIGRVAGVGEDKARILLLSDPSSQISAVVMPERIRAIVRGNNASQLEIIPIDSASKPRAGARVVTSGSGALPPDLLIGYVTVDDESQLSVRVAADYGALEFARILMPVSPPEIPLAEEVFGVSEATEAEPAPQ